MYKDCALLDEIDDYLSKYGFLRVEIDLGPGPNKIDKNGNRDYIIDGWGDALYIKKKIITPKNIGENRD